MVKGVAVHKAARLFAAVWERAGLHPPGRGLWWLLLLPEKGRRGGPAAAAILRPVGETGGLLWGEMGILCVFQGKRFWYRVDATWSLLLQL